MKTATSSDPVKPSASLKRLPARERLLAAADELFYDGSIHTVGIDRVIEHAGVAKASLYDTFGSKEALIQAYLEARQDARKARITDWLERYDEPRARLLGVFDAMADLMKARAYRGCAFTRASSESAPDSAVRSSCDNARNWMRDLFARLALDAGVSSDRVAAFATQLLILYDGASVMGQMEATQQGAMAAREVASVLLDHAVAGQQKAVKPRKA